MGQFFYNLFNKVNIYKFNELDIQFSQISFKIEDMLHIKNMSFNENNVMTY